MDKVTLRSNTKGIFHECISLKVASDQEDFIAPKVYSLAQAKVNPLLTPLAMIEVIWRLKMMREIECIGTSVAKGNQVAEKLYRDLDFIDGDKIDEREIYLKLNWDPK
jgi:hypothetical protein